MQESEHRYVVQGGHRGNRTRVVYGQLLAFAEEHPELFVIPRADKSGLTVVVDSNNGFGKSQRYPNSPIYYDGMYGLVATLSQVLPVSLISFDLGSRLKSLDIVQIQRLERMGHHMEGATRWRQRLIEIVEEFASSINVPAVRIQPSTENVWVKSGDLDPNIAKAMYDTTARRLKYAPPSPENPWWVKTV